MKKLLIVGVGVVVVFSVFLLHKDSKDSALPHDNTHVNDSPLSTPTQTEYDGKKLLFVPYWTLPGGNQSLREYDEIAYFGISATEQGINKDEEGFKRIQWFKEIAPDSANHLLTVRIINSDIESKILRDKKMQERVIFQSVDTAIRHDFDGILLDYESSALGFEGTVQRITDFHAAFSKAAKGKNILFYSAIYGDVYFRSRPYEVKEITKVSDKIVVMAYDFHKARGRSGPVFPLQGKEYPYNFQQMISDFSKDVPLEKLTITFGLFGYDWKVDKEKNTIETATPFSYMQGKGRFLDTCNKTNCRVSIDADTREVMVEYMDEGNIDHIVWFETPESVQKKIEYLSSKGIKNIGWWAYSFF